MGYFVDQNGNVKKVLSVVRTQALFYKHIITDTNNRFRMEVILPTSDPCENVNDITGAMQDALSLFTLSFLNDEYIVYPSEDNSIYEGQSDDYEIEVQGIKMGQTATYTSWYDRGQLGDFQDSVTAL